MDNLAKKVQGKTIVDLFNRDDDWQNGLEELLDQYGTDTLEVEIGGCRYKVRIMPEDNPVAIRLVLIPKAIQGSGDAYWKKGEKSSRSAEQRKAEWLAYLAEHNIPLHDPSKQIVEKPPFSIMGDLPFEE